MMTPEPRWHAEGELPQGGEVFVFGSNLAGRHGAGAALVALEKFGAQIGRGQGYQGSTPRHCYAIATKDAKLGVLPLEEIARNVRAFIDFAENHPNLRFFVTRVGCGLAGYRNADIAPLFHDAPLERCSFEIGWRSFVLKREPKAA